MKPTRQNTLYLTIKQVFLTRLLQAQKQKNIAKLKIQHTRSISSVMRTDFHIMIKRRLKLKTRYLATFAFGIMAYIPMSLKII